MIKFIVEKQQTAVSIEPAFPPDSNSFKFFYSYFFHNYVSIEPAFPPDSNAIAAPILSVSRIIVSIEPAFPPDSNKSKN